MLLNQLTAYQIAEWIAYDTLDPIGKWRDDYAIAQLLSQVTNIAIGVHGKKGAAFTTPSEFLMDWGDDGFKEPKKQSVVDMKNVLISIAEAQKKEKVGEKTKYTPPSKLTKKEKK